MAADSLKANFLIILFVAIAIAASIWVDRLVPRKTNFVPNEALYEHRSQPFRQPKDFNAAPRQAETRRNEPRKAEKGEKQGGRKNWAPREPRPVSQRMAELHHEMMNDGLNLCLAWPEKQKFTWSPHGKEYITASVVVDNCSWTLTDDPTQATLLWTIGQSDMPDGVEEKLRLGKGQIWNQIQDGWSMTDKTKLHYLLSKAQHLEYQPETFILANPKECVEFFKLVEHHPEYIWVTKVPTSSQGEGITVNPPMEVIKEQWLDTTSPQLACKKTDRKDSLIQRYIRNPLLLEGKKMEIRSYWVLASVDPLIIFYRDGTVRLTTRDYKEEDWNDPLIHITNTKQQKKADPNYYKTEAERKWTLEKLADYLKTNKKIEDQEKWLDALRVDLKERIAVSVLANYPKLLGDMTMSGWDGRFELFGMDVILDSNLKMWLTELQDGPGLSLDPGVKRVLIPRMIKELTDIVLEIDVKSRLGQKLDFPLTSRGEWQQLDMTQYLPLLPPHLVDKNWRLNVN